MEEYQNRKDIDKLLNLTDEIKYLIGYDENKILATSDDVKSAINGLNQLINEDYYEKSDIDNINDNLVENIQSVDSSLASLLFRLGLDKENASKFNFAVVNASETTSAGVIVEYQEYWILSNAYYSYDDGYFHKIDMHNTSFGIQIQGKGAFRGEAELGYFDNSGVAIWRNPSIENLDWATAEQKRCLVETGIIGEYDSEDNIKVFQVSCGWNNGFMFDSYGGMTIGGTGFEIDGNGIFPYTRVANCLYTNPDDGKEYGYIALLHNAYNSTRYGWDCDSNRTYSWLMGIHAPVDETLGGNNLDLTQADFRVMYNDTPWNAEDTHELDISEWNIIFKADMTKVQGMVDGSLTTLGEGGDSYVHPATKQCNYSYIHPTTKQCNYSYIHPTTKQCNYSPDLSNYVTETELETAIDEVTTDTGSIYLTKNDANNTYLKQTIASSTYLSKTDATNTYAPKDHSNSNTTYGVATDSKYGHTKASTSTPLQDSANGSSGTVNGVYANANHSHPQSILYAPMSHVQNTDTINIAGTQNQTITAPIKILANAITGNNFYHIFYASSTTTWANNTIYLCNIGDMTYKPLFSDGSLCTLIVSTSSSVDMNNVKMVGTSGNRNVEYVFTMEKEGLIFEDPIPPNSYVLCLIDFTNYTLKVVGVY